jgi:hypothetical protein
LQKIMQKSQIVDKKSRKVDVEALKNFAIMDLSKANCFYMETKIIEKEK